jgi:hypothetical protein
MDRERKESTNQPECLSQHDYRAGAVCVMGTYVNVAQPDGKTKNPRSKHYLRAVLSAGLLYRCEEPKPEDPVHYIAYVIASLID